MSQEDTVNFMWCFAETWEAVSEPQIVAAAPATAGPNVLWALIASLIIGSITRLLKEDVTFLPTVPASYRLVLVAALGLGSAVLEKVSQGVTWQTALLGGLVAALGAVAGHEAIIERIRGGREIGGPPKEPR